FDLEQDDALRLIELSEHAVELGAWEAGPRGDGDPRPLEHRVRLAPVEEATELVCADHEDRVVEALGPEQVDGARVRIEAHVVARKGRASEREPVLRGGCYGAVGG